MRFTTQALRAWRPYLTNTEMGVLHAWVDAGMSYDTGTGTFTYGRLAQTARLSRRQLKRYARRFHALGVIKREFRFWIPARPAGDHNRANRWTLGLPVERTFDSDLEEFQEAKELERLEAEGEILEPGIPSSGGALVALPGAAPLSIDDTPTSPVEAAAQVAAASCSTAPASASAVHPVPSPEVCVLAALRQHEELASIADEPRATRIWRVARRCSKSLAQVEAAIRDAADQSAGRTGLALEDLVVRYVRRAKEVTPAAAPKTPADARRERQQQEEQRARDAEKASAARAVKMRAAQALGLMPRPPDTG